MISDEKRREVAELLRQMADTHHAVEASRVTRALGLEYEVYGTVLAFNSAAVQALADLIDRPTCRNLSPKPADVLLCSECGEHVDIAYVESCDDYHAKYCPNCGAEVANDA